MENFVLHCLILSINTNNFINFKLRNYMYIFTKYVQITFFYFFLIAIGTTYKKTFIKFRGFLERQIFFIDISKKIKNSNRL